MIVMKNTSDVNIVTFILDDSKIELNLMERVFKSSGIENFKLFTKEEDFWMHYHKDVHVAVLDYLIKPGNGLDIAEKLLEKNPYCKIIIRSSIEDDDVPIRAINIGIYKWIKKNEENDLEKCVNYVKRAIELLAPFIEYQQSKLVLK